MTNQEAIEILKYLIPIPYRGDGKSTTHLMQTNALIMAIKALEQESILDKIKSEILCNIVEDDTSGNTPARLRADWDAANKAHMIDIAIIEKNLINFAKDLTPIMKETESEEV